MLEMAGFVVTSTTSGARGIGLVRESNFDLILLDIYMPEMSGFETLEKVRSFSSVPVIVFTARPDIFDMVKKLGANDYIAKPLNPDMFLTKIKDFFSKTDNPHSTSR